MILTVGELKKRLQGHDDAHYVCVDSGSVLIDVDSCLITSEATIKIGPVECDCFLDFDEMSDAFKKEYDETRPWVQL